VLPVGAGCDRGTLTGRLLNRGQVQGVGPPRHDADLDDHHRR
jgi:hypothetical protein